MKIWFQNTFEILTGFKPYPWQTSLFDLLIAENPPELIYAPTGAGKSDVITVWLCAVLNQIHSGQTLTIPRRLYFAIDRRVVVDQTELLAATLLEKIDTNDEFRALLKSQTISENPLVVSVMRGQRITEQEPLIADPSAFGITLCTPDMLLSRLLFSSYSSGHRLHSREAGLIQDSYIVLDEVHISEPARRTLEYVNAHNRHGIKNWWYTCMTATPRNDCKNELGLSEDDRLLMKARLNAHKRLNLVEGNVLDTIKNVKHDWQRMIIYVEQPAHATRLASILSKDHSVILLTGTMRVLEKSHIDFGAFKPEAHIEGKHILICTSAGEVGLNVSSDFLISEFTYADRLAQRLGRLNRWAECEHSYAYVIAPELEEEDTELKTTLAYFKSLNGDVSGQSLYDHPIPAEAFSPKPTSYSLNDVIITQLANTSVQRDISPEPYIRGLSTEYHVDFVIRNEREIDLLTTMDQETLETYVTSAPVLPHEIFREAATRNLSESLTKLFQGRETLLVDKTGSPEIIGTFESWKLRRGTLYVPDDLHCISTLGMFEVGGTGQGDVFAQEQTKYRRFVFDEEVGYTSLDTGEVTEVSSIKQLLKSREVEEGFKAKVVFSGNGLIYIKDVKKQKKTTMLLSDHVSLAGSVARQLCASLNLDGDLATDIVFAAEHHDDGKAHWLWQTASHGNNDGKPLAKVRYFYDPKLLGGMRHELLSAMDSHGSDLAEWLIASHHGRCRPYFEDSAFAPDRLEECEEFNKKLPGLFEQMTKQYGHWNLAYLEALIRGIDIQSEEQ